MKELAKRVEEKLKKFEQIAEVKYFNRLEVFHRQAEKEVREEIELGFRERKRNNISIKFLSDKIMILDLGVLKMIKRNEEKFKRLAENFNETLTRMQAMNDEELCDYIDDEATMMFFMGSGISGSIDLLSFNIPFTIEELADYLKVDINSEECRSKGFRYILNEKYLLNKCEVLEHFLIDKKEEFYKSITDYVEKKLTDNGINKRYDDLMEKLDSMEDEEFANYIYGETVILTNTLSGGIYGMIDEVEFETNGDGLLNLPKEDSVNEEKMYKTTLVNKRKEIMGSIKKSKEEELALYLESDTFF